MSNLLGIHPVVPAAEWLAARKELLVKEKELTRLRDKVDAERRAMPWVRIEKEYVFQAPEGERTLADLFDGRSQLLVQHFMFGPGWSEGCVGCSFKADHVDGTLTHLEHHDVSFVAVSRAPLAELEAFKKRMGWHFRWVSSYDSDFNMDYNVSYPQARPGDQVTYNYASIPFVSDELSGNSVFYKDAEGRIFHTYSTYGRGDEMLVATYMYLDLTPKGRNETGPRFNLTDWVRHHDRYGAGGSVDHTGRAVAAAVQAESECGCREQFEVRT